MEKTFTEIFKRNAWGCDESVSGPSSTLARTKGLRRELPGVISEYGFKTVLDGPCGDFNWMRHVVEGGEFKYVGVDIVRDLVARNRAAFSKPGRIEFLHCDLTVDELPSADLLLARDFLFHLSFFDTNRFLHNFERSRIPYLLTTTHRVSDEHVNKDIVTGSFRHIDLFSPPYRFDSKPSVVIEDGPDRFMCLWSAAQIRPLDLSA